MSTRYVDPGPRPNCHVKVLTVEQQIDLARSRKAAAISTVLIQYGFTSEQARTMDEEQWALAAEAAHVNRPSEETAQQVVYNMEIHEKLAALQQQLKGR